ncbi:hypothetical protein C0J52_11664 [Blattella germanica]|nr:hypothetical protein C0J52_11664 [Blattella germanica]
MCGEVYREWLRLRYHYLALTPEVLSLLRKLRQHYLLCLITNGPSRAQWEKVEFLHLRSYFDYILVSGDLPWEKPNPNIFLEACNYLGVQPKKCLMVGDKLETDILGGIKAHIGVTVWLSLSSDIKDAPQPQPDFIINNIMDLCHLLPSKPKHALVRSRLPFHRPIPSSLPDLEDYSSNGSDGS